MVNFQNPWVKRVIIAPLIVAVVFLCLTFGTDETTLLQNLIAGVFAATFAVLGDIMTDRNRYCPKCGTDFNKAFDKKET